MKRKSFFLSSITFGIMLLNNTATAYAEWDADGATVNGYSGQVMLSALDRHNLDDFRRADPASTGGDALFGSSSVQEPVNLVYAALEISIMTAGEIVPNRFVNGKACLTGKTFQAFVSPSAACSSVYGSNFSGFKAQAEDIDGTQWKPMLYMNVRGRWVDIGVAPNPADAGLVSAGTSSVPDQCAQVLVQKICQ